MASLFSSPPKAKAAPPPVTDTSKSVQRAKVDQKRGLMGGGRSGNVLTSPTGVASAAPVAYKTLLGA